ncbi:AMP-binding protein, partial [Candidatus Pelagibacter sp.]|nr:AMP-binding protein [Candidatus Pelagibacter sp.]
MNQYRNKESNEIFLQSIKDRENKYNWNQTFNYIQKLSSEISNYIEPKDRCLLISENRPEWLISDLSIMLAQGITVPAYTTYTERD